LTDFKEPTIAGFLAPCMNVGEGEQVLHRAFQSICLHLVPEAGLWRRMLHTGSSVRR